jgi:acetyl-CoA C-acetyltransferase
VQAREIGLSLDDGRGLTVTGGMTFAGGPLNSYVLHAVVTLARQLREEPTALGLSTSVSGMLTKPGAGLWSATPPAAAFQHDDVTEAARMVTGTKPLAPDATGPGSIAGATVLHGADGPRATVAIVDLPDGSRTVAVGAVGAPVDAGDPVTLVAPGAYCVRNI